MNSQNNKNIFFPDNSGAVALEILKKNNLEENLDTLSQKAAAGKPPNTAIISRIIKEAAENNFSLEKITLSLRKNFNIPQDQAQTMSEEINSKIISQAKIERQEENTPPNSTKEKNAKVPKNTKEQPPNKPQAKSADSYREAVK